MTLHHPLPSNKCLLLTFFKRRLKNCFSIRLLFLLLPPCEQACTSRLQTCGPADSRNEQKYMSKVILKHVRLQLNEMGKRISTLNCWPIDTQINKMAISFKQLLNKLALSHSILGWFTVQLFQLQSSHFYSRILKIRTCLKRYTLRNP